MNFKKYSAALCLLLAFEAKGCDSRTELQECIKTNGTGQLILDQWGRYIFHNEKTFAECETFLSRNPALFPFVRGQIAIETGWLQGDLGEVRASKLLGSIKRWQTTLDGAERRVNTCIENNAPVRKLSTELKNNSEEDIEHPQMTGHLMVAVDTKSNQIYRFKHSEKGPFTKEEVERFAAMSRKEATPARENLLQPEDIVREQFTPEAVERFDAMSLTERKQSLLRLQPKSWPLAIAQARSRGPHAQLFADALRSIGFGF